MLDLVDNEAVVLAVLGDRYRLPVDRLAPGRVAVAEAADPRMPVRALHRGGGAVVAVAPAWSGLLQERLDGPASLGPALDAVAAAAGGQHWSWVARTGVAIPAPSAEVTVLDATDPRLPEWVIGHFSGEAWVVLGDDGQVLSTAVLKRYDDRLPDIGEQPVGALGGQRREHGEPDRAADLDARVDEPRGEAGVARRGARHRERHQRREGEAGAEAQQEGRGQDVDHVVGVHRRAREQQEPDAHDRDGDDDEGEGQEHVHQPLDDLIGPAAHVRADHAEDQAEAGVAAAERVGGEARHPARRAAEPRGPGGILHRLARADTRAHLY
jgi:hypothetical protein